MSGKAIDAREEGRPEPAPGRSPAAGPRRVWPALVAGIVVLITYRVSSFRPTYPVQGRLLIAGEPADGAVVEFHRIGAPSLPATRPRARVREDGSFELANGVEQVGAPAGTYAVTVVWREAMGRDEAASGPNRAPEAYARPESTPLRITVIDGTNRLPPIRLEARPSRGGGDHVQDRGREGSED